MRPSDLDRRQFVKTGAALSVLGAATPFAVQMAAAGTAAAQSATDYKALVCIFMFGGNDSNNMLLASDTASWNRYFAARNTGSDPIALMPAGTAPTPVGQTSPVTGRTAQAGTPEAWGGVLPVVPTTRQVDGAGGTRTFGVHPFMSGVQSLWSAGRMAAIANVGSLVRPITKAQYQARTVPTPANLFSHNDQQSVWQAGAVEGARVGWGGRMGDLLASSNGAASLFTAISTAGNAVFLSGRDVVQYQLSTAAQPALRVNGATSASLFGSSTAPARLTEIIQGAGTAHYMQVDHSSVTRRSMNSAVTLNNAFAAVGASVAAPPAFTNPITGGTETNGLAVQLQTVARMVASSESLGAKRQVFFVSIGGWDTHDFQNRNQAANLARVSHALAYFDSALSAINGVDRRNQVTTFTASDFNRTFNTNGDGTDHAWGGHHLVMGGAVKGGDMYGLFPTIGIDGGGFVNPDMVSSSGHLIPTTAVDQYAATLGGWFGVSAADLATIFPNLGSFNAPNLGFMR